MYSEVWKNCHPSICSIKFYNEKDELFKSGTGFKVKDLLITNSHVFSTSGAEFVSIIFVSEDGHTISKSKKISFIDFYTRLEYGIAEATWDFSILRLDDPEFKNIPSLKISDSATIPIGHPVAVMGFQFDQSNLSIKGGILSSRYRNVGVKYMQVDASVNHGNSGGPLINPIDSTVIGLVTRKHTGLTNAFDGLIQSFDQNIQIMEKGVGVMQIFGGIDIAQVMVITQNQLKIAAKEILRSANVGVGFAFELDEIIKYLGV